MDDDADLEAEIERELEQAEQERLATAAAKRRPKLLEVGYLSHRRLSRASPRRGRGSGGSSGLPIHHFCETAFLLLIQIR